MKKKIVLFGAQGMLGSEFFNYAIDHSLPYTIIPLARFHADLRDSESIVAALKTHSPDIVINMAAFTNVDSAEEEWNKKEVFSINTLAPETMAMWCAKQSIPFFHISTDYVFAGNSESDIFSEDATPCPINYYGETKFEAEQKILSYETSYVVRTSWLVGDGHHFVGQIVHLLKNEPQIQIIHPQIGSLTFISDFIPVFFEYIKNVPTTKIVHIINEGVVSRLEIVREIQSFLETNVEIIPISSDNRLAKRPLSSALTNTLLPKLPEWRHSLHRFLLPEKEKLDAKRRKHRKIYPLA